MYLGLTDLTSSAKCFLYSQNLCSCMCLGIPCTRRPWECVRERCVAMTDAQHASLQGTLLDTRNLVLSHVAVPFPSQGHLLTLHLLAFFFIFLKLSKIPHHSFLRLLFVCCHILKNGYAVTTRMFSHKHHNYYSTDDMYWKWNPLTQKTRQIFLAWENQQEFEGETTECIPLGQPSVGASACQRPR